MINQSLTDVIRGTIFFFLVKLVDLLGWEFGEFIIVGDYLLLNPIA